MRAFFLLAFSLVLSGCLSTPVPEGYHGPLATVSDTSVSISSVKVQFFELTQIDGRRVASSNRSTASKNYGRGFLMTPVVETREVPATTCTLHIQGVTHVAMDIMAFAGGMYSVEGDVTVKLLPSQSYTVRGILGKDYSAVWLADSEGHVVSKTIEKGTGHW